VSGPEPFPQLAAQRHAVLDGMYARLGQFNLVRNVLRVFRLMDGPHPGHWTAAAGGES